MKSLLNLLNHLLNFILTVDEEEITFAPTYRFERDTREKYAYTKAKATGVSLSQMSLAPISHHSAETVRSSI